MKRVFLILLPSSMLLLCGCKAVESELGIRFNTPERTQVKLAGLRTVVPGDTADQLKEKADHPWRKRMVETYEVWEWRHMLGPVSGWAVLEDGQVIETGGTEYEDPDRKKADIWLSKQGRLIGGPNGRIAIQKRRQEHFDAHPELATPIHEMIVSGEIGRGMSPADVTASWGEPDQKKTIEHDYGRVEQWSCGRTDVFFENGEVSVWQVPD